MSICSECKTEQVPTWSPLWSLADRRIVLGCQCTTIKHPCIFQGKDAEDRFKSVESFITIDDERFPNADGMIQNGLFLAGHVPRDFASRPWTYLLYAVDGKVWIKTKFMIARLGDYSEVKENYPDLFTKNEEWGNCIIRN